MTNFAAMTETERRAAIEAEIAAGTRRESRTAHKRNRVYADDAGFTVGGKGRSGQLKGFDLMEFEIAGWDNALSDGAITEEQFEVHVNDEVESHFPQGAARTLEIKDRSTTDSPVTRVWEIAFEALLAADEGTELSRKQVVAAAVAEGIALNTAKTQYQRFYQALTR
jgi:hypothetical protein